MQFRKVKLAVFVLLSGLSSFSAAAHATDYTWVGGDANRPTDWSVAANWQPNGIPGAADKAAIGSNQIVNVSSDVTVSGLSIDTASTLQGSGMVTVNDALTVEDATLDGGDLNLGVNCVSEFNSVLPPASTSKNNKARKKVKNKGKAHINSGNLVLSSDFENDVEGTVEIKTDGAITWTGVNNPKFRNYGKLVKSGGAATSTITAPFENTGMVIAQYGDLDVGPAYKQLSGRTMLNGGSLSSNSPITFSGGTLEGTGIINGSVVNSAGHVAPGHSPGSITILGNFTQTANGTLDMQIGGLNPGTQYDQISVQGNAILAGTLNVTWLNGFQPNVGDSFTFLEYWSSSGTFQAIKGIYPGNRRYLTTSYTPSYFLASTKLDATTPRVAIASPASTAWLTGQFPVNGTASDVESGVAAVTVRLYRQADATQSAGYWNGTSWDSVYDAVRHERRATGTTSWSLTLPKLPTGRYSLRATALDNVGNGVNASVGPFGVDNGIPSVDISTPANGAFLSKLLPIKGTAADDPNGSGLASIQLTLKQVSTGKFWTGSAWGAATNLAASFSGNAWHSSFTLPTGANLPNGVYQVTAKATDKVGQNKSVMVSHTIDTTPPGLAMTTPANAVVSKDLPSTSGTSSDASSKVKAITIRLYRYASPLATAGYWNGTSWDETYDPAKHELAVNGLASWSRPLLPNAATRTDGKYTVQVTATDGAGNVSSVLHALYLDSRAPESVTIDSPVAGAILNNLSRIAGTSADNSGGQGIAHTDLQIIRAQDSAYWTGKVWQLAPAAISTVQSGVNWSCNLSGTTPLPSGTNLLNGKYNLIVIAYDKAGNSKGATSTFIFDKSPPTVQITSPVAGATYKQLTKITGTSQDLGTGITKVTLRLYRYATSTLPAAYWDGANWTATYSSANEVPVSGIASWSLAIPALGEGRYFCVATATDKAANSSSTANCTFTIDSTLPAVAITRPATNPAFVKSLSSILGTASDNFGLGKVTLCLYRYATATTAAGYWNGAQWTAAYSPTNEVPVTGSTSWSFTPPALAEGRYSCVATAVDKAGSAVASPKLLFTIDATPPAVTITAPPAGPTFFKSLSSVTGKSSDLGGINRVTLRLYRYATATSPEAFWDGANWSSTYSSANEEPVEGTTAWSFALPALDEGRYFCVATATDNAGNSSESAKAFFTIDSTGASVSFTSPADGAQLKGLGSISGKAVAAGAPTSQVKLLIQRSDGQFWTGTAWADLGELSTSYNSSTAVWARGSNLPTGSNLPDGVYTLTVNATDGVGNLTTAVSSVTIDNSAPAVGINQPVSGGIFQTQAQVTGDASDSGVGLSTVTLRLFRAAGANPAGYWNGTGWDTTYNAAVHERAVAGTTSWSFGLPELADGQYTLRATAKDNLGNTQTTADVPLVIDASGPETITISTPATGSVLDSLSALSGTAADANSGIGGVTVTLGRSDGLFWTGTDWGASTALSTEYDAASGNWNFTGTLPSGAELADGDYTLTAQAVDGVGNTAEATSQFTVTAPPPVPPASSLLRDSSHSS